MIKTTDGGKNWQTITFSSEFLHDTSSGVMGGMYVSPFNPNILFSSGQNLVRSTDGGYHWEIVQRRNALNYLNMHFFSPEKGVALYGGSAICTTTDSGFTWTKASYPETELEGAGLFQFPGQKVGYAIEYHNIEASDGYYFIPAIIKSTDEGATWEEVASLNYPFNTVLSMDFVNDRVGYLVKTRCTGCGDLTGPGFPQDAELLKTTDGGKTWHITNDHLPTGIKTTIHFINESEGVLVVEKVYRTTDGGKNWKKISKSYIDQFCFPDDHLLYALDPKGNLIKFTF